jgi:hypothetical protein
MVCPHQTQDRHIMDVPTFFDLLHHYVQRTMTRLTLAGPMGDSLLRLLHHLQRLSTVACVPSPGFVAACTFLPVVCEAITRRRLPAVLALCGQSPLSLFSPQQRAHGQPSLFLDTPLFLLRFCFAFGVLFSPSSRFFCHARGFSAVFRPF